MSESPTHWRVRGKCYVTIPGITSASDYEVHSHARSGEKVPALLLREGDSTTLVVPELNISQRVELRSKNRTEPSLEIFVRAHGRGSRLDDATSPLQVDERPFMGVTNLWLTSMRDRGDGLALCHICVQSYVPRLPSEVTSIGISIEFRGPDATPITADVIDLGRSVRPTIDGGAILTCQHSVTIPLMSDHFYISATVVDSDGNLLSSGFATSTELGCEGFLGADALSHCDQPFGPYYHDWFLEHRTSPAVLRLKEENAQSLESVFANLGHPLFSIIVPLYETPIPFFEDMAHSVLTQIFGDFELVLVNASPDNKNLTYAVKELARSDARITVVTLAGNRGISLNTKAGIDAATGEFICLFDHDDLLEPDCLYHYANAIASDPEVDLVYCDEDKWRDGTYEQGAFKPDFDWNLLESNNYICHMLCVRTSLARAMHGMESSAVDGAQDHDLTFRVAERARSIVHIPKVLYHWRFHRNSTAADPGSKTWTSAGGLRAVSDHLSRIGVDATVTPSVLLPNYYVPHYKPDPATRVSIVIPNKDCASMLERCVESIYSASTWRNFDITIVENNSRESRTWKLYDELRGRHGNLQLTDYSGPFNFSAICNHGAQMAMKGFDDPAHQVLLFLNNDTEVLTPNWIEELIGPFERQSVVASGAKLLYADDAIQHAGIIIPQYSPVHLFLGMPSQLMGYMNFATIASRNLLAVTGACIAVKAAAFRAIGGFDEGYPVNYNDVDLCLRLHEAGGEILYVPHAELRHYESVSRGNDSRDRQRQTQLFRDLGRFTNQWPAAIALGDPYYSRECASVGAGYLLRWNNSPDLRLSMGLGQ